MPVTLCFIKDKHKVMEHKIPLETYFAGLLQKVEWQIQGNHSIFRLDTHVP